MKRNRLRGLGVIEVANSVWDRGLNTIQDNKLNQCIPNQFFVKDSYRQLLILNNQKEFLENNSNTVE